MPQVRNWSAGIPWASYALREAVPRRFHTLKGASSQVKHPACRCRSVANRTCANVLIVTLTTVGPSRGGPAKPADPHVAPCHRWKVVPNVGGGKRTCESAACASVSTGFRCGGDQVAVTATSRQGSYAGFTHVSVSPLRGAISRATSSRLDAGRLRRHAIASLG